MRPRPQHLSREPGRLRPLTARMRGLLEAPLDWPETNEGDCPPQGLHRPIDSWGSTVQPLCNRHQEGPKETPSAGTLSLSYHQVTRTHPLYPEVQRGAGQGCSGSLNVDPKQPGRDFSPPQAHLVQPVNLGLTSGTQLSSLQSRVRP